MYIQPEVLTAIIGGIFLLVGGTITGLLARKTHQEVTVEQLWDHIRELESRERIRDDYIYELRSALAETGKRVPPWPEGLTAAN